MAVQVKLSGVKQLSNTSLTSIVEFTNFNIGLIASAVQDFLRSINYVEGEDEVSVEIASIDSDVVQIKQKLSVLGTQLNNSGAYDEVIRLEPSGSVIAKNVLANDVLQGLRVRLKVFGQVPPVGVPGEIIYIQEQPGYEEGFYGYLISRGWVCLSCGDSDGGPGGNCCCNKENIIYTNAGNTSGNGALITNNLSIGLIPALGTGFMFFVNGMQIEIGDGTKNAPVYLSDDNGANAISFYQASPNSKFYWNASYGGFDLDTNDRITMRYIAIDPTCGTGTTTTTTTMAPISTTTTTAGVNTTTTTVFITSTTIPCAADTIVHVVDPSNPTSRVTFTGTPIGPFQVQFTDAYGTVHYLTSLGNIIMPWVFDLSNPYYSSVPTINGVYRFTEVATGCVYVKQVGPSTTTTSTSTSTTSTSTSTTTTSTTTLGTTTTTSTTTTTTTAPPPIETTTTSTSTTSTSTSTTSTTSGLVDGLQIRVSTDFSFGTPNQATVWYAFKPTYDVTQPYPLGLTWTQLGTVGPAALCNSYSVFGHIENPPIGSIYIQARSADGTKIYSTNAINTGTACAGGGATLYTQGYGYSGGSLLLTFLHLRIQNAPLVDGPPLSTTTTSTSTTSTTAAPPDPTTTSTLATTTTSTTQLGPQGLCCEVTVTPEDAQLSDFNTVIFTYRDVNNVIQQAYIQNSTQLPSTTYYCVKQAVSLEILTAADPIPVNTSTFVVTSTVCNNDTVCLPDNELTTTTTLGTTTSTTINDTTTTSTSTTSTSTTSTSTTTTTTTAPTYANSGAVRPYSLDDSCPCNLSTYFTFDTYAESLGGTSGQSLCAAVLVKSTLFTSLPSGTTVKIGASVNGTTTRKYREVVTNGTEFGQFTSNCLECVCEPSVCQDTNSCQQYSVQTLTGDTPGDPGVNPLITSIDYFDCNLGWVTYGIPVNTSQVICVCGSNTTITASRGGSIQVTNIGPCSDITTTTTLGTTTSTTINDTTTTSTTTALPCEDFIVTITDDGVGMQQYTVAVTGQPGIPVTVSYRSSSSIVNYGTGFTNFSQSFNLAYDMDLIVTVGDCTFTYSYDYDTLGWIRVFPYDSTCHEVTVTDEDLQASAYGLVIFGYKDINRRPQTSSISQAGRYTYCIQSVNYLKVYNASSLDPVTSSTVVNTQQVCTSEDGCLTTTTTLGTTTTTSTTSTTTTTSTTAAPPPTSTTTSTSTTSTSTTSTTTAPQYSTESVIFQYSLHHQCPCEVNIEVYLDTQAQAISYNNTLRLCSAVLIKSILFQQVAPGTIVRVGTTTNGTTSYRNVLTNGSNIGQFTSGCITCECTPFVCESGCMEYEIIAETPDENGTSATINYFNCNTGQFAIQVLGIGSPYTICACDEIAYNVFAPHGATFAINPLGPCSSPATTTTTQATTTVDEPCNCTSYVITNLQNASDSTISYTDCNTGIVSTARPGDFGIGSFSQLQSITICSQTQPTFQFLATVTPNGECCGAAQAVTVVYLQTTTTTSTTSTTTTTQPTTTTTTAPMNTTTTTVLNCTPNNCLEITVESQDEPVVIQYVNCTGQMQQATVNPNSQYSFCYCEDGGWAAISGDAAVINGPVPCELNTTTTTVAEVITTTTTAACQDCYAYTVYPGELPVTVQWTGCDNSDNNIILEEPGQFLIPCAITATPTITSGSGTIERNELCGTTCEGVPTTTTTTSSPCIGYTLDSGVGSASIEWIDCNGIYSTYTFTGQFTICTDGSGYTVTEGSVTVNVSGPCG